MQQPRTSHLGALHNTLTFINATIGRSILLQGSDGLKLHAQTGLLVHNLEDLS